jgi:TetR/AcrR family transcriptional regulator
VSAKSSVSRARTAAVRDPQKTRERILSAALVEFSAKGLSGARVDNIARRARINKRMLYHYFGNKQALFREVLNRKMADRATWMEHAPEDPMDIMPYWFDLIRNDRDWVRLLEWEALERSEEDIVNVLERTRAFAKAVDRIKRGQKRGLLSSGLDPRHVVLSTMSMIMFPLAFPQLTRIVTGLSVSDPEFQTERTEFLAQFAKVIGSHTAQSFSPEATP